MAKTARGSKKPNLFAKAAGKSAKPTATKRKKGTIWEIPEDRPEVAEALQEVITIGGEVKALQTKQKTHMTTIAGFAFDNLCDHYADDGVPPETPLKVVNAEGESVTYVVQDRSTSYEIKNDEIVDNLMDVVGEDKIDQCVYTRVTFGFNPEIMEIDGVSDVLSDALQEAIGTLKRKKILDADQADALLVAKEFTAFRPGIVARAAAIMGKGCPEDIRDFLEAINGACVRYCKV